MNEALLHTIWKYKLIGQTNFIGTKNEQIEIISIGEHNQDSGPDFFNCKVKIDTVLFAGNVELHIKTSDWLKHNHQFDKAFDNLILHVVYEHNVELQQNNTHNVPVIELKSYIKPSLLEKYTSLSLSKQKVPCGKSITSVSSLIWKSWLDRLVFDRIENKTDYIKHLHTFCNGNYEEVLYVLLLRNFGFKINNEAFELLAKSLSYQIVKKYANNPIQVQALLFGVAGFLDELYEDDYPKLLQNEFEFLKHKHQLIPIKKELWKFSKTRPVNFPTIRIAQLSALLSKQQSLFHFIESKPSITDLKSFFEVNVNDYWLNHYQFDVISDNSTKQLGESAFHVLVINTVVPFLFFLSKQLDNESLMDYALELLCELPAEHNSKTKVFEVLGVKIESASESQALIQLFDFFCSKKACLNCNVAKDLLKNS